MEQVDVDHGQAFDFGRTSEAYARYRDIYPEEMYARLLRLGVGTRGSRWLDLGTGTGVVPRAMACHGAVIIGTDISEAQIRQAEALSADLPNITYRVCPAEDTRLPGGSFDAVTACQCFWYFDPERIVPEIRRLLIPGGVFVKAYMTWTAEDPIARGSEALVRELNPRWVSGAPAERDLEVHYFDHPVAESFEAALPFTRESWHGRMLACRGVLGSMDSETAAVCEERHRELLRALPERFTVRHRITLVSYRLEG